LVQAVRHSPVVAPDETGWKVGGRLWWLWVFVTPEVTVYTIQPGRGPRRSSARAMPASSCATAGRPIASSRTPRTRPASRTSSRRTHHLLETAQRGAARFPRAVRRLLLRALALRDRRARGELGGHGLRVALGRLEARTPIVCSPAA